MSTVRHCARCGKDYPADAAFCPDDGSRLTDADANAGAVEQWLKPGTVLDDRYVLEEKIGAGGLGQIYRARHLRMHRAFAVKLLQRSMVKRPDFIGRFEREARALSRLTHPCCVAVTDYGVSQEYGPFIVMELIEGESLSTFTRGRGLPLGEVVDLMIGVLAGLDHAHKQGIVHRDIKPDNVMIVEQPLGPGGRLAKILDFGLAKIRAGFGAPVGQTLTETGFVIGTPHYLPPERVTNPTADDPRSDLYAVGVILFELCCGRRPFEAPETPRVVEMHLIEPPPRPTGLRPDLPLGLELVILRALQKRPEDRFPSAREFRQALQALLPLPSAIAKRRPGEDAGTTATHFERPPPQPRPRPAPRPPMIRPLAGRAYRLWPLLLLGGASVVLGALAAGIALFRGSSKPAAVAVGSAPATATRPPAHSVAVPRPKPPPPPAPARAPDASTAQVTPPASEPASDKTESDQGTAEGEAAPEEPPGAAAASASLPAQLRQSYRLWTSRRGRGQAARQFMSYLNQHRDDAASHLFVARLYLYAFWTSDGLRLVQRALQIDRKLRLDTETLIGLAFAYRAGLAGTARRLIEAHGGADAARILLVAASVMRDRQMKNSVVADARRRIGNGNDALARALDELADARSCGARKRALKALPGFDAPAVRVLLSLLRSDRCLGAEARKRLK